MKIHFIGIDDANLIFDASFERRPDRGLPEISHIMSMARHAGIHIQACSQIPHQLGASIHSNAFTKIMFSLANGRDIDNMINSMGIKDREQQEYCHRLKEREAIIKFSGRYTEPFLARIPEMRIVEENISDDEVRRNNEMIISQFRQGMQETQQETHRTGQAIALPYLSEPKPKKDVSDLKEMLMHIYLIPFVSVTQRYRELNLSLGAGSRIINKLIKRQVVKAIDIRTNVKGGVTRFLEITPKGYEILNLPEKKLGRGSGFEHFLYQNLIANHLKTLPEVKKAEIEGRIYNKCMDVLVTTQNAEMIAIEVAMDSVTEYNNIVKDLKAGCSAILIIARNPKVKEQINQILESLGQKTKNKVCVLLLPQLLKCKSLEELLPGGEL